MKAFAYTAVTETGRPRKGSVVAPTEAEASAQLAARGLYVTALTQTTDPASGQASGQSRQRPWTTLRRARLDSDIQAVFTRQMAVLLTAGLPVEAALEAVRQSDHKGLEAVAAKARAALLDGAPLSEALSQSGAGFAPYYLAALKAGEDNGELARVFAELADHLDSRDSDRNQIATALIYPAFVATVALIVCAILMVNVAPEIVALFELSDRPLPDLTRWVLAISDTVQAHPLPILSALLACGMLGLASSWWDPLRQARDRLALRLPVIGRFMARAAAVQYLRTLALVLASRQTVLVAAENAQSVLQIAQYQAEAARVVQAIRQGQPLSQALQNLSFIPPVARQLIQAGEASAKLATTTERSAVLVETALRTDRKRLAALLEPALMMLVGGFVLLIILAVLLPIFDLQAVVAG